MKKRILSMTIVLIMVLSLGLPGFALESDKFTRAEAALYLINAMGATGRVFLSDITDIRPDESVTREEAFDMLARTIKLSDATSLSKFADAAEVSPQYYGTVAALVSKGFIKGIPAADGTYILNPKGIIKRGEFAALLDSVFQGFVTSSGITTKVVAGNIVVKAAGATLKNLTVMGDLIIADSVGDDEVTLDSVKILGRLVVRGGGKNSVNIKGTSDIGEVIVARTDGAVSVKVQDDSAIQVIYVTDGKNEVIVSGSVKRLVVQTSDVPVTLSGGTVGAVTVAANNAEVKVASDSVIANLSVAAKGVAVDTKYGSQIALLTVTSGATNLDITGNGTIAKAVINASRASIENAPATTVVGGGVSGTEVAGSNLSAGSTANLIADSSKSEYIFSPLPSQPQSPTQPELSPEPLPEPTPPEPSPSPSEPEPLPEPPPSEPSPPETVPPIKETFTVTLNLYKDAATYTGYNKTFTLKNDASEASIIIGSGTDGIVTFADVGAGTWSLYDGTNNTGKNITVTDKAETEALYYHTLTFQVIDVGPAAGSSSISSDQTPSTNPAIVLRGTIVKLTVVGSGKDMNIYSWTVDGVPSNETGNTLMYIINGKITINCAVIGID